MKRIYFLMIFLVLFGCHNKERQKLNKITIAQTSDFFLYAPLYIAKDAKIFEKQGLDVSILNTGGDEKTWAAVISGDASFGLSDPTFIILSEKRGQSGKVISNIVNGVPFWGITYNKKIEPLKELNEIKKYTVGTFPSPSTAYSLQKKMFSDNGLVVNIKEGAFGTMIPMLKANQVDIALELEPNVSQAVNDGAKIIYSLSEVYGDFAITGLTTTDVMIKNDPKLVQDVVTSIQKAIDFIHAKPDSSLHFLIKRFTDIDKNIAQDALQRVINDYIIPQNTITKKEAWDKAVQLRIAIGDIETAKNFEEYVDNSFAKKSINK